MSLTDHWLLKRTKDPWLTAVGALLQPGDDINVSSLLLPRGLVADLTLASCSRRQVRPFGKHFRVRCRMVIACIGLPA